MNIKYWIANVLEDKGIDKFPKTKMLLENIGIDLPNESEMNEWRKKYPANAKNFLGNKVHSLLIEAEREKIDSLMHNYALIVKEIEEYTECAKKEAVKNKFNNFSSIDLKEWYFFKLTPDLQQAYRDKTASYTIEKETAKAVLMKVKKFDDCIGSHIWVPKSAISNLEKMIR